MSTRLVAVLGYSDRATDGLHPVCAARLARAEKEVRPDDVLLFSGWSRRPLRRPTEADLMAVTWTTPVRARVVDRTARTTLGNARGIARLARKLDANEVVLVTSSWHARRASALVRASLVGSRSTVRVIGSDERITPARGLRELLAWTLVPFLVLVARTR